MEFSPAELMDKMTILKLKIESMDLVKEYEEYKKIIEKFKKQGIDIKQEWFDELYNVNKEQWDIYSKLNNEKNTTQDLEQIGRLYIAVEKSNKKRVAIKNEIVIKTGTGCRDIQMN